MQISLAALALVAASLVDAQSAEREEYRSICRADPPKTSKTYSDGHEIEYVCDAAGDFDALLPGSGETTATSDDCAQACKAKADCKASDWYYSTKVCNMYKEGHVGDEIKGAIFMRRITPPPAAAADDSDALAECKKSLSGCEAEKDDLTDDLDACKKALSSCKAEKDDLADDLDACRSGREADKKACEEKVKTLEGKLETCEEGSKCEEEPVWQRRKEAMKICGYGGRKTITAGSTTYTAHCNRRVGPYKFYKQAPLSVDDCLAECSRDTRCKAIHYAIMNDSHCKFLEEGATTAFPVEGEADCSRNFMIGFAPTVPK